jgi:hypothetical protein
MGLLAGDDVFNFKTLGRLELAHPVVWVVGTGDRLRREEKPFQRGCNVQNRDAL